MATANHHQWQINLHKLQSQSLDLQQIPNPKTSKKEKRKRKRKRNSKSSTNTTSPLQSRTPPPTIATNIAGPKLNQPLPQPRHHHRPKIPTQPINQWPKTYTLKPIPNLTPTTQLRDLKVGGEGCGGWWRWGGLRSWAKMREILSREDWKGRDREWRREKKWERRERNKVMRKEREKRIKKILNQYSISVRTLSSLRAYCSMS